MYIYIYGYMGLFSVCRVYASSAVCRKPHTSRRRCHAIPFGSKALKDRRWALQPMDFTYCGQSEPVGMGLRVWGLELMGLGVWVEGSGFRA